MVQSREIQVWIKKACEGDPLAVSKLLAKYHSVLRARAEARLSRALRAKSEPEDILQEVYLDVFRQISRFESRGPDSFLNWVLTILDNKLVDIRRALYSRKRDIAREVSPRPGRASQSYWNLLDELYADSDTPSRAVRRQEAVGALSACLAQLPDSHRQVIQLRFLEGHSVEEVAGRLNKSQAVIVALTKSALRALRESMDRMGEFTKGS